MIPIYLTNVYRTWTSGIPQKNPLYFIRKAMGTLPADAHDIIVLNADSSPLNINTTPPGLDATPGDPGDVVYIPPGVTVVRPQPDIQDAYDVESIGLSFVNDAYSEPKQHGGGSIAMEPRTNHGVLTIKGFVRGNSFTDLQQKISFLNYAFDPVINYLEGSSTFDNTVLPTWQPFENAGFHILAWTDAAAWRTAQSVNADYWTKQPYERLNRMIFGRSIAKPVKIDTKFSDMNAPFEIQLLLIDPAIYEFIPTTDWFTAAYKEYIDAPGDNDTIVYTDYLWQIGPGWREATHLIPTAPTVYAYNYIDGIATNGSEGFWIDPALTNDVLYVLMATDETTDVQVWWDYDGTSTVSSGEALTLVDSMTVDRFGDGKTETISIFRLRNPTPSSDASSRILWETDAASSECVSGSIVLLTGVHQTVSETIAFSTGSGNTTNADIAAPPGSTILDLAYWKAWPAQGTIMPAVTAGASQTEIIAFRLTFDGDGGFGAGYGGTPNNISWDWSNPHDWVTVAVAVHGVV